ncbi:hypothetical protein [Paenibacillus periandrae]|uniref:hypothetical protein n=1 Tax=Paenibacillus periandrae TaxID=1761741 RepID=UPI001F089F51|nr:hypothetical protein [Paenibacillus periandrae]
MYVFHLASKTSSAAGDALGSIIAVILLTLMMSGPLFAVVTILYSKLEKALYSRRSLTAGLEAQLLELAHAKGGTLTIPEVSMNTDLSLEESEIVLDSFVKLKYINLRVSEKGAVLYDFPRINR